MKHARTRFSADSSRPKDADYTVHRMILGTHTSGQSDDLLMIAEVILPKGGLDGTGKDVAELYDEEKQGEPLHSSSVCVPRVSARDWRLGCRAIRQISPTGTDSLGTRTVMCVCLSSGGTGHLRLKRRAPELPERAGMGTKGKQRVRGNGRR